MTKFYDKKIEVTEMATTEPGHNNLFLFTDDNLYNHLYEIYYIDSEWAVAPTGGSGTFGLFPAADVGFGDGNNFRILTSTNTMTGTVQFIVVRKSDRKAILFHGDADGTALAEGTWTFTNVTGKVWHEGLRKLRILGYV